LKFSDVLRNERTSRSYHRFTHFTKSLGSNCDPRRYFQHRRIQDRPKAGRSKLRSHRNHGADPVGTGRIGKPPARTRRRSHSSTSPGQVVVDLMRELLLCPPDFYGIEYEINPWMSRARGAEAVLAQKQWATLQATLATLNCKIELIEPQPKLPDMVFTANAALAVGSQF